MTATATVTFLFVILVPSLAIPVSKPTTGSQLLASFLGVHDPITNDAGKNFETTDVETTDCSKTQEVLDCVSIWSSGPQKAARGSETYCSGFDALMKCVGDCFNSNAQFQLEIKQSYWYNDAKQSCKPTSAPSGGDPVTPVPLPISSPSATSSPATGSTETPASPPGTSPATVSTQHPATPPRTTPAPESAPATLVPTATSATADSSPSSAGSIGSAPATTGTPHANSDIPSATAGPTSQPTSSPAASTIVFKIITPMSSTDFESRSSQLQAALANLMDITNERVKVSHSDTHRGLVVVVGDAPDSGSKSVGEAANQLEKAAAEQLAGLDAFQGFPLESKPIRINPSVLQANNEAPPNKQEESNESQGVSGGMVAGIIVGGFGLVAIIGLVLVQRNAKPSSSANGDAFARAAAARAAENRPTLGVC